MRRQLIQGVTRLHVTWFGGEPLLHMAGLRSLSRRLMKAATFAGAGYSASIITYDTLLDDSTTEELRSLQIREVQISLDGTRPRHDASRVDIRGRATFDRILTAIGAALANMRVSLRIQVGRRTG